MTNLREFAILVALSSILVTLLGAWPLVSPYAWVAVRLYVLLHVVVLLRRGFGRLAAHTGVRARAVLNGQQALRALSPLGLNSLAFSARAARQKRQRIREAEWQRIRVEQMKWLRDDASRS